MLNSITDCPTDCYTLQIPLTQFNIEDYEEELPGLLAIPDRLSAVQLIRSRYRQAGALSKTKSSRFRGVSLHSSGRWEARITLGAGADRRYKVRVLSVCLQMPVLASFDCQNPAPPPNRAPSS